MVGVHLLVHGRIIIINVDPLVYFPLRFPDSVIGKRLIWPTWRTSHLSSLNLIVLELNLSSDTFLSLLKKEPSTKPTDLSSDRIISSQLFNLRVFIA